MSYLNPNYNEIKEKHKDIRMSEFLGKSYLNLAKYEYFRRNGKKASLDDSLAIIDIFTEQWGSYYSEETIQKREKEMEMMFGAWIKGGCKPY